MVDSVPSKPATAGHGVDRRGFLKTTTAGLAAGTTLALLPRSLRAAEPKSGGRLRLAMGHGSTTDSTDPHTLENGFQVVTAFAMVNCLTEIDTDGSLAPSIAEEWSATPDAKEWTFKIRKGVEFHDGRTLTADDVAAILARNGKVAHGRPSNQRGFDGRKIIERWWMA